MTSSADESFFTGPHQRLLMQTTTLNNCACVLRQCGDLSGALRCLQAALGLETAILAKQGANSYSECPEPNRPSVPLWSPTADNSGDDKNISPSQSTSLVVTPPIHNPAGTHLNLCAVLSKLKRHEEALHHAQSALELIDQGDSPAMSQCASLVYMCCTAACEADRHSTMRCPSKLWSATYSTRMMAEPASISGSRQPAVYASTCALLNGRRGRSRRLREEHALSCWLQR